MDYKQVTKIKLLLAITLNKINSYRETFLKCVRKFVSNMECECDQPRVLSRSTFWALGVVL